MEPLGGGCSVQAKLKDAHGVLPRTPRAATRESVTMARGPLACSGLRPVRHSRSQARVPSSCDQARCQLRGYRSGCGTPACNMVLFGIYAVLKA